MCPIDGYQCKWDHQHCSADDDQCPWDDCNMTKYPKHPLDAKMGQVLLDMNLESEEDLEFIRQSLLENAVIVLRSTQQSYRLSRAEQVRFTQRLGKIILLPKSLETRDPEPGFPHIQRVTNLWSNGTRKGKHECSGCEWHRDGDFQLNDYLATILYADELTAESAKQTWFLDTCAAFHVMNDSMKRSISDFVDPVSIRNIWKNADEADLALFDIEARHRAFYWHPGNDRRCVYLSPFSNTTDNDKNMVSYNFNC
jgi:alpha-ketoglutarate-dependent taurine dioxygenase